MSRSKKDGRHSGSHHRSKCHVCQNHESDKTYNAHRPKRKIKSKIEISEETNGR